jgi:putative FmdB family regulatory protein
VPRYEYNCSACGKDVTIQHLSDETVSTCPSCETDDTLVKQLTTFRTNKSTATRKQKVGDTTEDFIKTSRAELHQQKKELKEQR